MKNKWLWIAIVLVIFVVTMFYGTDKLMCTPPCI